MLNVHVASYDIVLPSLRYQFWLDSSDWAWINKYLPLKPWSTITSACLNFKGSQIKSLSGKYSSLSIYSQVPLQDIVLDNDHASSWHIPLVTVLEHFSPDILQAMKHTNIVVHDEWGFNISSNSL